MRKELFIFFPLSDTTILINGKPFEGTADYVVMDGLLKSPTGASNMTCITEFTPVVFPHAQMVYKLLVALHKYNFCCFVSGAYALYVGGLFDTFDGITIFIAMTDVNVTPILYWLQKIDVFFLNRRRLHVRPSGRY